MSHFVLSITVAYHTLF